MRRFGGRPEARCPRCGALERHRALWLFLEREIGIERIRGSVLHVAPEAVLEKKFAELPDVEYVAGDLSPQRAGTRRVDVTNIDFPDDSFDVVVINHVLEHVPDDRRAIAELRRVLRDGGMLITQHPLDEARADTYEDASITTNSGRREHFGQFDHVRRYGRDFADRLRAGGFTVESRRYADEVTPHERELYALAPLGKANPGDDVYVLG
jgi:SAM-dependent methyltransferase